MVIKSYEFVRNTEKGKSIVIENLKASASTLYERTADAVLTLIKGNAYYISIDGSGSSTGVCLFGLENGNIVPKFGFVLGRSSNEDFFTYRVKFKQFFTWVILNCYITRVYYEQPFIGFATSIEVLYSLRTVTDEIVAEFDSLLESRTKVYYISNQSHKRFLRICFYAGFYGKSSRYQDDQKKDIEKAFKEIVEIDKNIKVKVPQDLFDAFSIGLFGGARVLIDVIDNTHTEETTDIARAERPPLGYDDLRDLIGLEDTDD